MISYFVAKAAKTFDANGLPKVLAIFATAAFLAVAVADAKESRPNVVVIMADDK